LGIAATIYLVDHEQRMLRPVPQAGKPLPEQQLVDATVAGRAFMSVEVRPCRTCPVGGGCGSRCWWGTLW
jgi:hypothetical protein